jgi:3-methylfumaryl-CoA hydratase
MNVDPNVDQWIGKSESSNERIAAFPANAMAATLNQCGLIYKDGDPLPHLWHWLYFLQVFNLEDKGYDGHPKLGGFLPPLELPRRMWAGSRLKFLAPMHIGAQLNKTSTIKAVTQKTGRSGALAFVTVLHQVHDGETLCIEEEHDIVYREKINADVPEVLPSMAPIEWAFSKHINPDPVLLFRYSALTFNGHRIHYDQPFCTGTEGYQGLVVHGPLMATMLLDLVRFELPHAVVCAFEFRALAPVFETDEFSIHGQPNADGKTINLWVRRDDGTLAIQAQATIK